MISEGIIMKKILLCFFVAVAALMICLPCSATSEVATSGEYTDSNSNYYTWSYENDTMRIGGNDTANSNYSIQQLVWHSQDFVKFKEKYAASATKLVIDASIYKWSNNIKVLGCENVETIEFKNFKNSNGVVRYQSADSLFGGLEKLKVVRFGNSTSDYVDFTNIGSIGNDESQLSSTFKGCTSIKKVLLDSETAYGSNEIRNKIYYILPSMFEGCTSLSDVNIPTWVNEIKSRAFADCVSLKTLYIPDTVKIIADDAFLGCNITLVGESGSAAETYAKSHDNVEFKTAVAEAKSALTFDGLQVRVKEYNGLRSLFVFDTTIENVGFELVEYGAILSSRANAEAYTTEITEQNGEWITKTPKIVKKAVGNKDGILPSTKIIAEQNGKVYFALTAVGYESNFDTDIYPVGYEIWKNIATGESNVIYTDYASDAEHDATYKYVSIYDLTLDMFKNGIINGSMEDDKEVCFNVLASNGAVTFSKEADYPSNMWTDMYGKEFGDTFEFLNVQLASEHNMSTSGYGKASIFADRNGDYVAIFRGGAVPGWAAYNVGNQIANFNDNTVFDTAGRAPNPKIPADKLYKKISYVVFDDSVTDCGIYTFNYATGLKQCIYNSGLNIGNRTFSHAGAISTVLPFGTDASKYTGYADLSQSGLTEFAGTFNISGTGVKKIRFPSGLKGLTDAALYGPWGDLCSVTCGEGNLKEADFKDLVLDFSNSNLRTLTGRDSTNCAVYQGKKAFTIILPSLKDGEADTFNLKNAFRYQSDDDNLGYKVVQGKLSKNVYDYLKVTGNGTVTSPKIPSGSTYYPTIEGGEEWKLADITKKDIPITDCDGLTEGYELDMPYAGTVSFDIGNNLAAGTVYSINVYAKGVKAGDTLTVSLMSGSAAVREYTYPISTQWTEIKMPFTSQGTENAVEFYVNRSGKMWISAPEIAETGREFGLSEAGTYMVKSTDWESVTIMADSTSVTNMTDAGERCMDVLVKDDYVYAITDGYIYVFDKNTNERLYKSDKKIGDLRQMKLTSDGKSIVIVARANGVFVFDISNPVLPTQKGRIDSLEMATGLDIYENYLFIADRIFGVDIFDISDVENPIFVSNISLGECQNVYYNNGYIYGGTWGGCSVKVYDVRDVDNPKFASTINLDSKGDGVWIKNNILYAATGQSKTSVRTDAGYGLGNGLEIYDISDPLNPKRLARVNCDGGMAISIPDIWRVYTAGNYCFLGGSHSGTYVYDISDPSAPVRVAYYQVAYGTSNEKWTASTISPFLHCTPVATIDSYVDGDNIYLCGASYDSYVGLYHAKLPESLGYLTVDENDSTVKPDNEYTRSYVKENLGELLGTETKNYISDGQIHAVAVNGDIIYTASGTKGIEILDKTTLQKIKEYPSPDITFDIQIYENHLYVAEGGAGIAIYEIDENDPTVLSEISRLSEAGVSFPQLQLSPRARFAVAQYGGSSCLVDFRDIKKPVIYKQFNNPMVYQYQISIGCAEDRYLYVFAATGTYATTIVDFGKGDTLEDPVIKNNWIAKIAQGCGICADGDYIMITGGNSVQRIPATGDKAYTGPYSWYGKYTKLEGLVGFPVVCGNYLFVARRNEGAFRVYEMNEDRTKITLKKHADFHGNPSVIVYDKTSDTYLLPLGYEGLVSFNKIS